MPKQILFNESAKSPLLIGIEKVAKAVGSTLGARGKTVIISNYYGHTPIVTKDGVTVSSSTMLEDDKENVGVMLIRNAAERTLKDAGDGTTQTVVLAECMIQNGVVGKENKNQQQIKSGLDKSVKAVVDELNNISINIGGNIEKIKSVATISANNDTFIGNLIADAYAKIGTDGTGVLDIEESGTIETSIEVVDGIEIPRGFVSPEFVNNPIKLQTVFEDPYFLVTEYPIKTLRELAPLFAEMQKENLLSKGVVIVAEDFEGEFYSSMVINHKQGNLKCCLVKAPSSYRKEHLEDIATLTGATVIRDPDGLKLENARIEHLGSSDKVIISEKSMLIRGGHGEEKEVNELKQAVKVQIEGIKDNDELRAVWEKRLARISGSVGIIRVGGSTDIEVKEKKDRVDDACRAVKSAIEEGIVVGGGVSYLKIMKAIDKLELNGDEHIGAEVLRAACKQPLKQMIINACESDSVFDAVLNSEGNNGYNFKEGKMMDLFEAGVIDPAKVIRCAIQNAASLAGSIITSDCSIIEIPKR